METTTRNSLILFIMCSQDNLVTIFRTPFSTKGTFLIQRFRFRDGDVDVGGVIGWQRGRRSS